MSIVNTAVDTFVDYVFSAPEELLKMSLNSLTKINDLLEKYDEDRIKRLKTYGKKIGKQLNRMEEIAKRW